MSMKARYLSVQVMPLGLFNGLAAALIFTSGTVLAHAATTVGDYELEIGFASEPAYVGMPNALELHVANTKTQKPVNGLDATLKAEIIYGAAKRELKIEPTETDGSYSASLIPTAVGDYTWHIFGTIEETPVDVSVTSGPDTFSPVEDSSEAGFPVAQPVATALQTQSQTALVVGVAGAVLGLIGAALGVMGMRRKG